MEIQAETTCPECATPIRSLADVAISAGFMMCHCGTALRRWTATDKIILCRERIVTVSATATSADVESQPLESHAIHIPNAHIQISDFVRHMKSQTPAIIPEAVTVPREQPRRRRRRISFKTRRMPHLSILQRVRFSLREVLSAEIVDGAFAKYETHLARMPTRITGLKMFAFLWIKICEQCVELSQSSEPVMATYITILKGTFEHKTLTQRRWDAALKEMHLQNQRVFSQQNTNEKIQNVIQRIVAFVADITKESTPIVRERLDLFFDCISNVETEHDSIALALIALRAPAVLQTKRDVVQFVAAQQTRYKYVCPHVEPKIVTEFVTVARDSKI